MHLALRCLSVWLAVAFGLAVTVWVTLPDLAAVTGVAVTGSPGGLPFDRALVGLAALALVGCAAWLWALTTVVAARLVLGGARGERDLRVRGCPAAVRRALLAACGAAALSGVLAGPAAADGAEPPAAADPMVLSGLPFPDRPTAGSPTPAATRAPVGTPTVIVRPGDTLWQIAAANLPAAADDAAVDARWRLIYALNRTTVGPDPDLVRPGLRLDLPLGTPEADR